jgi:HTH-type transcriptional regulator / antitoxin HigA
MPTMMLGTRSDSIVQNWKKVSPEAAKFLLPIETKKQYETALELLEAYFHDEALEPFLQVLVERIEAYESKHFPIPDATSGEVLAFLLDQRGLTQQAVEAGTGIHQSALSRLIKGEREPSVEQIKKLATFFEIDPAVFL